MLWSSIRESFASCLFVIDRLYEKLVLPVPVMSGDNCRFTPDTFFLSQTLISLTEVWLI